jgi:hypothetical protein
MGTSSINWTSRGDNLKEDFNNLTFEYLERVLPILEERPLEVSSSQIFLLNELVQEIKENSSPGSSGRRITSLRIRLLQLGSHNRIF